MRSLIYGHTENQYGHLLRTDKENILAFGGKQLNDNKIYVDKLLHEIAQLIEKQPDFSAAQAAIKAGK